MQPVLATDPPVSEKQRAAMWAAAHGKSNIGISRKIGEEFVESDPGGKLPKSAKDMNRTDWGMVGKGLVALAKFFREESTEPEHQGEDAIPALRTAPNSAIPAAGVILTDPTYRVLFTKRSGVGDAEGTWAFPGGKIEQGEKAHEAAARELKEETGHDCDPKALHAVDRTTSHGADFTTYHLPVAEAFDPQLNDEHTEFKWAHPEEAPSPLHPGAQATLTSVLEHLKDPENADGGAEEGGGEGGADAIQLHNREVPASGVPNSEGADLTMSRTVKKDPGGETKSGDTALDSFPADAFLGTYRVKTQGEDGAWAYDGALLESAARRAARAGRGDLARRANALLAQDTALAMDWAGVAELNLNTPKDGALIFAFDRDTVRKYTADGHLRVETAHISKANVCPYKGSEIPNYKKLGLDPDKIYQLYRDPDELKAGLDTFNNLPILADHQPGTADNHPSELVIGSTGTDAKIDGPYLNNSLVFWPKTAIDAIESNAQKQLSCAYRYRADMQPGKTPDGEEYDGVMRDIRGNHVALVKEGRAGPDVVVGDSAMVDSKENSMPKMSPMAVAAKGAFTTYLSPRLAQDAKPGDIINPIIAGITKANFTKQRPVLTAALKAAVEGQLAQDADIEDVEEVLDAIEGMKDEIAETAGTESVDNVDEERREGEDEPTDEPNQVDKVDKEQAELSGTAAMLANLRALVESALTPEQLAKFDEIVAAGATDEKEDEPAMKSEDMEKKVETAVDAAIKGYRQQVVATREAEQLVRPWVGDIAMSFDSASDVYGAALKHLKVDLAGIPPEAYKAVLMAQPKPGVRREPTRLAQDSAATESFGKRFPAANHIEVM